MPDCVLREVDVVATQVVQWFAEHPWLAPVPVIWFLLRTRTARTVATAIRGEIRDRWLRAKTVPEDTRQELAIDTMRRDQSRDLGTSGRSARVGPDRLADSQYVDSRLEHGIEPPAGGRPRNDIAE